MEHVTFPNGLKMPLVGFGTSQSGDEMQSALHCALQAGYRHIDTAALYMNEAAIGQVLAEWIQSEKVRREELFIVTKLPPIGNRPEKVERFIKQSLHNLQLDYVDLYLIHFPAGILEGQSEAMRPGQVNKGLVLDLETDLVALWRAMEAQVDQGRAKSIGLSNFNSQQIERVVKAARIKPANLQVEVHAYFQQKPLRALCARHGISVCAYAPLGSGGRFKQYLAQGRTTQGVSGLLENDVVMEIAKAHSKMPAQILLRHLVQQQVIVIPKSVTPERIQANFKVLDFSLSEREMQALDALDQEHGRTFTMSGFEGLSNHPEFPFHIPY